MESAFLSHAFWRCDAMWADRPTGAKRGEIEAAAAMNSSISPFLFLTSSSFGIAPPLFIMLTREGRRG